MLRRDAWCLWLAVATILGLAGCGDPPEQPEPILTTQMELHVCSEVTLQISNASPSDIEDFGPRVKVPSTLSMRSGGSVIAPIVVQVGFAVPTGAVFCTYQALPPPGPQTLTFVECDSSTLQPGSIVEDVTSVALGLVTADQSLRAGVTLQAVGPDVPCMGVDACTPIAAGTPCSDGNVCNGDETCSTSGACVDGAPPTVSDGDPCTLDSCDPIEGLQHVTCSPLDPTVPTRVADAYAFIYTGPDAVQKDLDPNDLVLERIGLLRGQVLDRDGQPVMGAVVTVLAENESDPDYGYTTTQADGYYTLAVNGGRPMAVNIDYPGHLRVQRRTLALWNDIAMMDDAVLTPLDEAATQIDLDALEMSSQYVVARGSVVSDSRGDRQVTALFSPGTTAEVVSELGASGTPLTGTVTFRATEYTVGDTGQSAMPAELPPTSAFTYSAELGFDGVAPDSHVEFSQPVLFFLENFLHFPVGESVPYGYLERTSARWVASPAGRVIRILSIDSSSGTPAAVVDSVGATQATALTLSLAERQQLASLYTAGTELWRIEVSHFSPCDWNWAGNTDLTSASVPSEQPVGDSTPADECVRNGSIIECEGQALGETIALPGVPHSLSYRSDRVPGRIARVVVPIFGETIPDDAMGATVRVRIAGKTIFDQTWSPSEIEPDMKVTVDWDGKDWLGRQVQGAQRAYIYVSHRYEGRYWTTPQFANSPGGVPKVVTGGGSSGGGSSTLTPVPSTSGFPPPVPPPPPFDLWSRWTVPLGHFDATGFGLGGWTLDVQHFFDPEARILYRGDGTTEQVDEGTYIIDTVIGHPENTVVCENLPLGPVTDTTRTSAAAVEVGADGSVYVLEHDCYRIQRIYPDGSRDVFWSEPFVPGTAAPVDMTFGPNGDLYLAWPHRRQVLVIHPDGQAEPFAGSPGAPACLLAQSCGDGGPAVDASFVKPVDVAVGPDGVVYIADETARRIRYVDPDGTIQTLMFGAGSGPSACDSSKADNDPACTGTDPADPNSLPLAGRVNLGTPISITVDGAGNLYYLTFNDRVRVWGVDTAGTVHRVVGTGFDPGSTLITEGSPANTIYFGTMAEVRATPDGYLFVSSHEGQEVNSSRVTYVAPPLLTALDNPNGRLYNLAGGFRDPDCQVYECMVDPCIDKACGDGLPAQNALIKRVRDIAFGPDRAIYLAGFDTKRIYRVEPPKNGLAYGERLIPSRSGDEVFHFDETGRHVATLDALSGTPRFTLGYTQGLLTSVTDVDGRQTTIARTPTTITLTGPFGQAATLTRDGDYLTQVSSPGGRVVQLDHQADGLLVGLKTPRNFSFGFGYGTIGRLQSDDEPGFGLQTLTRTELDELGDFEVSRTVANTATPSLDVTTFAVAWKGGGALERTVTQPGGSKSTSVRAGKNTKVELADGSTVELAEGPDPRFRDAAPLAESYKVQMAGIESEIQTKRTVVLTDPQDLFSIATHTDEITIDGRVYVHTYDATGADPTFTSVGPTGLSSRVTLDPVGRLLESELLSAPAYAPIEYEYYTTGQQKGFLKKVSQGVGAARRETELSYDSRGRLLSITDPLDQAVVFGRDLDGRVLMTTLPDSALLEVSWDASSNLDWLDPPGATGKHFFTYDERELVSSFTPPLVGAFTDPVGATYTPDRQPDHTNYSSGGQLDIDYDAYGRPRIMRGGPGDVELSYWQFQGVGQGKLKTLLELADGSSVGYAYNADLLSSVDASGPVEGTVSWTYGSGFRVEQESLPGTATLAFVYDDEVVDADDPADDGRLVGLGQLAFGYEPGSGFLSTIEIGAIEESIGYSTFGEVESYLSVDASGSLYEAIYERDKLGRVLRRTESVLGGPDVVHEHAYDLRGRLEKVWEGTAPCDQVTCTLVESYTYDANGNRTSAAGTLVPPVTLGQATYDAQDRLTAYGAASFLYDRDGYLETKAVGSDVTEYDYDLFGGLRYVGLPSGMEITYVLDPLGRRIAREIDSVVDRGWVYGASDLPVAEVAANGTTITKRFVYGTRSHVPDYMVIASGPDAGTYRFITDQVGSVRLVVDVDDGTVLQELRYDSFGRILYDSAETTHPDLHPFRFAGGLYDRYTGLVRFGARDYDPTTGRWTARDPILYGGGSSNLYAYVDGDPINLIDPAGLAFKSNNPVMDSALNGGALSWLGFEGAARGFNNYHSGMLKMSNAETFDEGAAQALCGIGQVGVGVVQAHERLAVVAAGVSVAAIVGRIPIWTAGKLKSAAKNALRHFKDHGADFGAKNARDYVDKAHAFLSSPPLGTLTKNRSNGDSVLYHPGSNTFGVMDRAGTPKTFFKPDPSKHGYPTNVDYYNAQ